MAEKGDQADMTRAQLGRKHSLTAASPGVLIGFCIRFYARWSNNLNYNVIYIYIHMYIYIYM